MAELLLVVMLVAATLYAVLGGADFGAGLVEPFVDREERERIDVAIAPVWEANHVWLVLLATLTFVAFPSVYAVVTAYLHIPLLLVLLGIVARGTAFTFRHYDPTPGAAFRGYTLAFRLGSFLTPLFLGLTVAATAHGTLSRGASADFYAAYVAPWNTWFGWATGLFVCALFAFEGAALLAAEHPTRAAALPYVRIARNAHLLTMALGAHVFVAAYAEQLAWFDALTSSPLAMAALALATLLAPLVGYGFKHGRPWLVRVVTGAQAACILLGFFGAQYPALVRLETGDLTVSNAAAPTETFVSLFWAVAIGLAIILPGTAYLIRVYKGDSDRAPRTKAPLPQPSSDRQH